MPPDLDLTRNCGLLKVWKEFSETLRFGLGVVVSLTSSQTESFKSARSDRDGACAGRIQKTEGLLMQTVTKPQ